MTDYQVYQGRVARGFQFASGEAVGRTTQPSPYAASTLRMQHPHFAARGLDLEAEVPNLVWATVNVRLDYELVLRQPDRTLEFVDWTRDSGGFEVAPETFSFVRCCLAYDGRFYPGLIYYPHVETKPSTNDHDFGVLEILTSYVNALAYDAKAYVICSANAFRHRYAQS